MIHQSKMRQPTVKRFIMTDQSDVQHLKSAKGILSWSPEVSLSWDRSIFSWSPETPLPLDSAPAGHLLEWASFERNAGIGSTLPKSIKDSKTTVLGSSGGYPTPILTLLSSSWI
ncbi:hypothetical protein L6164_025144 [Bauhinia variegata]|uniref:Uncharacterized protein n=1 Tax=Bauhinia variegata TaxID=167791 RepID=A0ACB9M010_BAUVA|nr:hypothetical protein L6164_025144 [Bauhinia variegata]